MKKILFIMLMMCMSIGMYAQNNESTSDNIIYVDIPKKMNIKDKIILVNQSTLSILQAVVVLPEKNLTLGSAMYVMPGAKAEMASFDDNWLKNLRGKRIAMKVKGVNKPLGDISSTSVAGGSFVTGGFGVGVQHKEIKADEINNIDESQITYNFNVALGETDHDLYIFVSAGKKGALDF